MASDLRLENMKHLVIDSIIVSIYAVFGFVSIWKGGGNKKISCVYFILGLLALLWMLSDSFKNSN